MAITKINGARQIESASITNAEQNFGTPVSDNDVAIKSYVDSVAQGLDVKVSSDLATIAVLSPANTYANGTAGVGATLTATGVGILTVDGVATVLNDIILVKNEASGLKNGMYKVTTEGTAGVAYVLTRIVDMDTSAEFSGGFTYIEAGGSLASTSWVNTNSPAPNVGTTAITFQQFSGAGTYTGGNGITLTGSSFTIDTSITVDKTTAQTLTNKTLTSPVINTPTGIVKGDVGLGNVDNTSDATKDAATATLTNKTLTSPVINTPTGIVKGDVGLGNVDNTTDANKPVSSAAQTALNLKADLASPTFTGTPSLPTGTTGTTQTAADNSTKLATTAYVDAANATNANLSGDVTSIGNTTTIAVFQRSTAVSGTQDDANKAFTIGNAVKALSEQVFLNGQLLMYGASNDYVISGTTVTFQAGFTAPSATDVIRVYGCY